MKKNDYHYHQFPKHYHHLVHLSLPEFDRQDGDETQAGTGLYQLIIFIENE